MNIENAVQTIGKKIWQIEALYYLHRLKKNLYLSDEDLKLLQNIKLRSIVNHAYRSVPYYRLLFDRHKVKPEDIKGIKDLYKIPITQKGIYRNLQSKDKTSTESSKERLIELHTGGSTGHPQLIYVSRSGLIHRTAEWYRILWIHGYNVFHKNALLTFFRPKTHWYNKLGILQSKLIPHDIPIDQQIGLILEYKPDIIEGYPSRLNLIARFMVENNISIPLEIIFSNSETLLPTVREKIESAMKNKVTNIYDCWEFGRVAWQCPEHTGLHISSDSFILQIVRDNREAEPGETGEVVITDLNNYTMPLLRYNIEDIASLSPGPCKCGLVFSMLQNIQGRKNDYLRKVNGEKVSSLPYHSMFNALSGIIEFQIVQNNFDSIDVNVVVTKGYDPNNDEIIINNIKRSLRTKHITVNHVKELNRTDTYKLRSIICKV